MDHDTHRHNHGDHKSHAQGDSGHADHDHGSHDHAHGIGGHHHAPTSFGAAFAIGIGLNAGFVIVEAIFGVLSHSMALLADAGHNVSDVLGLLVAYVASRLVTRRPSSRFTYGMKGSSILAALFNAVFLLVIVGGLSWEAILRLASPEPVAATTVMIVAAIGIAINGVTAWLFMSGRESDINLRGAFLHMASDALVSAGVVVAGLITLLTQWTWLDPVISLAINAIIIAGTWSLLRDSVALSLQAVPRGIDPDAVKGFLVRLPGVVRLHDLHIWPMSTTETALTTHLEMPEGHPGDGFLQAVGTDLRTRFNIAHATIQIECGTDGLCVLALDQSPCFNPSSLEPARETVLG